MRIPKYSCLDGAARYEDSQIALDFISLFGVGVDAGGRSDPLSNETNVLSI